MKQASAYQSSRSKLLPRPATKMHIESEGASMKDHLPRNCTKSICSAPGIAPIRNVVQHLWILIEHWVDEAHWRFTNCESFLVDKIHNRRKNRRACASATGEARNTSRVYGNVVTVGANVRIATAGAVLKTLDKSAYVHC